MARTSWTTAETEELLRLLLSHHTAAGDNAFKQEGFNKIADKLNQKFPSQRVLKTGKSCRSKWANLKSEYTLISAIRGAFGFHYDDSNGVVVDDRSRNAWATFCKFHAGAAKYEGTPWPYWNDVSLLMPSIAKGTHVYYPARSRANRSQKKSCTSGNATSLTTSTPTGPSNTHNLQAGPAHTSFPTATSSITGLTGMDSPQALVDSIAAKHVANNPSNTDTDVQMTLGDHNVASTSAAAIDPNSISPSVPSSYLSHSPPSRSTVSMSFGMTSVSRTKRKVSSVIGSNAESEGSQKRSRPVSATAQAKIDIGIAIQRMSQLLEDVIASTYQPISLASVGLPPNPGPSNNDYIEQAAETLMSFNLSPSENNDLADYMSDPNNKSRVKFFLKFDNPSRKVWIKNVLTEIQARRDGEMTRKSMDHDARHTG